MSESGENVSSFTQDTEYWYSDGTVILLARAEVGFRVHKGILADHSTVFGDLFAVSQPQGGEWYGDCPIVHLSDAPSEVRWLLKALYHPRRYVLGLKFIWTAPGDEVLVPGTICPTGRFHSLWLRLLYGLATNTPLTISSPPPSYVSLRASPRTSTHTAP